MATIDFSKIRSSPKSRNDSFESLAVQLFRGACSAPSGSSFYSLRGDGGDGGVEAFFKTPSGDVLGVQAKYFFKLDAAELSQISESLSTALSNHPSLVQYWVYIPFDPTGRTRAGKGGKSQTERFDEWKISVENEAASAGKTLTVTLCSAATIRDQLQRVDAHGGFRRYWFNDAVLTSSQIESCLEQARAFAGPRYTAELDVVTKAHTTLDFFGGVGDFATFASKTLGPLISEARSIHRHGATVFGILPPQEQTLCDARLKSLILALQGVSESIYSTSLIQAARRDLEELTPSAESALALHQADFNAKYGASQDTPAFRQFQAEYMCVFPAAGLDFARDLQRLIASSISALDSPELRSANSQSLLLVGPAGAGKTHAIVSSAYSRLAKGGHSLVVFGDDFNGPEPWEVLRTKLGFGAAVGRDELLECLQASSENSGLPFVIFIDALNESMGASRWKTKLPELLQQCKPYSGVKVCVSARDTYRDLVVDSRFPGFAFKHAGFEGRQFEALQAFAKHYGLDTEITPIFAEELSNPLFLHLACRTFKDEGRHTLDVSLPGFTGLLERHLAHCDDAVRGRLGYANPRNVVRAAMMVLADQLVSEHPGSRSWANCTDALKSIVGTEVTPETLLAELRKEGLIILTQDENDEWTVRLGYQRYGDVLRAMRLLESSADTAGDFDLGALKTRLASFTSQDDGLLEMLAAVLPEHAQIEITSPEIGIEPSRASRLFVKALPWRSRDSIPADIDKHILAALHTPELWPEVYEVFFKLALVPEHRLNAERWLMPFLKRQPLVDRDAYLSRAAVMSFDAGGATASLIDASLRADIERWPATSRRLAIMTLGWLTSCADRKIRDQATKGLVRLVAFEPTLAELLVRAFSGCDDDYVLESVVLTVYASCLFNTGDAARYATALEAVFTGGYDTSNVNVRDAVRLTALRLDETLSTKTLTAKLSGFLRRHPLPKPWPSPPDAEPLRTLEHLPSNMDLTGEALAPDFWRYQVEPLIAMFDLTSSGIARENIASWVMVETLRLGYPGKSECALRYDLKVGREHGQGRGRERHAERLGKKYYWISLHRLVGLLSDNVKTAESYSGRKRSPGYFWSSEVRKCDPTDVRDISPVPLYPDEILAGPRYPFPPQQDDMRAWARLDDLTKHENCIVRKDRAGTEWVALSVSAMDNNRSDGEDNWSIPYLNVEVHYRSMLADSKFAGTGVVSKLKSAVGSSAPHCYQSFLAEYPDGPIFEQSVAEGDTFLGPKGLRFTEICLMRGNEWEYDFGSDDPQKNLTVPCQQLVRSLGLVWDRQRGWTDEHGTLVAFEAVFPKRSGLFVRKSALDSYLERTKESLLFYRFASRGLIAPGVGDGCAIDVNTYLQYQQSDDLLVMAEDNRPYNC